MQNLIKLIYEALTTAPNDDVDKAEYIAQYLLDNGVKVGDVE